MIATRAICRAVGGARLSNDLMALPCGCGHGVRDLTEEHITVTIAAASK